MEKMLSDTERLLCWCLVSRSNNGESIIKNLKVPEIQKRIFSKIMQDKDIKNFVWEEDLSGKLRCKFHETLVFTFGTIIFWRACFPIFSSHYVPSLLALNFTKHLLHWCMNSPSAISLLLSDIKCHWRSFWTPSALWKSKTIERDNLSKKKMGY